MRVDGIAGTPQMLVCIRKLGWCALLGIALAIGVGPAGPVLAAAKDKKIAGPIDLVRQGYADLRRKRYTKAVGAFSAALKAGGLAPDAMAKALYYRGQAYRGLKQPTKAITDFSSALWLKGGLRGMEREDAEKQREAAYAEAGARPVVTAAGGARSAQAGGSARRPTASRAAPAPAQPSGAWTTSTRPAPGVSSRTTGAVAPRATPPSQVAASNPVTSFFSNLFGGGAGAPSARPPSRPASPPRQAAVPAPKVAAGGTSISAWTSSTKVSTSQRQGKPPVAPTVRTRGGGRYVVQVAALPQRRDAEKLAARLAQRHGKALQGREATVNPRKFGNMGTLYQVRVGGFRSKAAAQPLCRRLQADGLDCLVQAGK